MTAFHLKGPATVLAILLGTTAAQAQVTAQDVWGSWQSQFGMYGESGVTVGGESLEAGVLTVTDLSVNQTDPMGGSVAMTIPQIVFTEQGDGTVLITMSDSYPIAITAPDAMTGEMMSFELLVTQSDMEVVVSGTPGAMESDLSATRVGVEFAFPESAQGPMGTMLFGMNDITGGYSTTIADEMMELDYAGQAASMDLLADLSDATGMQMTMTGKTEGLELAATATIPLAEGLTPDTMFAAGLAIEGSYGLGASSYAVQVNQYGMTTDIALTMASGLASAFIDAETFGIDSDVEGLGVQISSAMMPFVVDAALDAYGLGLSMPVAPGEGPQPFDMRVNLSGLSVNEEVWSMLDPGQILPRDPATLAVNLSGTVTMLVNLFDPAAQELMNSGAPPGEVNSVALDALNVVFGGAQVTGSGGVTLDNADLTTFPGMPRPEGSFDIAINGANALMDNLVALGVIPEDQIMMGRMMLGMFAVPVGDDMLESKIEFTADGAILANGQRIQ